MTTIDEKRGERLSHVAWMALKRCIGGRSKIIGQWRANWITSGGLLISWNDKRTPFRPTFVILRYRGIMYRGGGVSYDYIHMVMRAERRYLARRGWSVINNLGGAYREIGRSQGARLLQGVPRPALLPSTRKRLSRSCRGDTERCLRSCAPNELSLSLLERMDGYLLEGCREKGGSKWILLISFVFFLKRKIVRGYARLVG